MALDHIIESVQSHPVALKLVQCVREITTKLNGGKEVTLSDDVKLYMTYALVILLGFAATRVLRLFLSVAFGLGNDLKKGAPTSVSIEYQKDVYEIEFTADDFSNEAVPADGITLLSLKFMVSKILTPKIYESKNKAAALATTVINPASFLLSYNGQDLEDDFKPLLEYGIRSKDTIFVKFATPKQIQEDDDEEDEDEDESDGAQSRRRVRNRAKKARKAKKGGKKKKQPSPGPQKEYGDFPEPAVKALTPSEEIKKVEAELEKEVMPLLQGFIESPPKDKTVRDDDHHRISELVLLKMFMMDGVDAAEPDVRQQRKEAINKMHKHLSALDKAYKAAV